MVARSWQGRSVWAVTVLLAVLLLASGCGYDDGAEDLDQITPDSWERRSHEGEIAQLCIGSWSECGQVEATYDTEASVEDAAIQLRDAATKAGWHIRDKRDDEAAASADHVTMTIKDRPEDHDVIIYVRLEADGAFMTLVKRVGGA